MPNLAETLKSEIRRLAKSVCNQETEKLRADSARYRKDIADLKRQVADLTREVKFLRGQEQKRMGQQPSEEAAEDVRFSPKWLKSHRQKLGLSQEQYGKLVGVSGLTIYNWEQGKTSPAAKQRAAWGAIRGIGKREAQKRLEMVG